jgi:uncharacterized protein
MPDLKSFHEQIKCGDLDSVRAAIAEDASLLDAPNESGQTAFLLAKYYRREDVAAFLLDRGPKLDLFTACVAGRTSDVLEQVNRDPSLLQAHSTDGWTPLHLAAFFGQADLANALLDLGAPINTRATNAMKNTPLHAAAAGGHAQVVELLLKRGADPNGAQEGGWTALHSAAQSGNRDMVVTLLANGANANTRAANNQSPLDLALSHGHRELAALLEELGAKLQ